MSDGKDYSRRDFFRLAGLAGAGSAALLSPRISTAAEGEDEKAARPDEIPVRPFGKTGVKVSCLSLGGMFDIPSNQLLLRQALKWGVTYWDTADCYEGGNSELGIGQFLKKYPENREKIFLVSKSDRRDPKGMTELLERSLRKMNTNHVDLYFIHGMTGIGEINKETKAWAEKAKAQGKIRFFGFSAHSNMEELMTKAAGLGWIDGIMVTYNYRIMRSDKMREAVEACSKAGIGITAMKTQGGGQVSMESETELQMAGRFVKAGFTDAQAKLKAVWEEPNIASICSQMPNMTILMSNIAAALNRTKLTAEDIRLLDRYAEETATGYCAGCRNICESALAGDVPVGDIMRFLMYHNSYGDVDRARACFAEIPRQVREGLLSVDYTRAEILCPQRLPIAKLIDRAVSVLA
ncbi:MAG: aldo/keto reductase [Desulfobacteraceae bacterium]|nr:aldo/keto reductase [Desulfobacteraceae bacterium]